MEGGNDDRGAEDRAPAAPPTDPPADVTVGPAREGERATAIGIVDMADGRVLGALVLAGERVEAVAVRPGRQGQGIGGALVAAARARRERLVAEFDENVLYFYGKTGFDIEHIGESRYRGVLSERGAQE